jgi:putative transposase
VTAPWLTAAELSGLPGMPGSEFRTRAKLDKLGVPSRLRTGRAGGGGREFDCACLPAETRAALLLNALQPADIAPPHWEPEQAGQSVPQHTPATLPAVAPGTAVATTTARTPPSKQDAACADARAAVLKSLDAFCGLLGGITKATAELARQLATGTAAQHLLAAAAVAHQRPRKAGDVAGVAIGQRTLFTWHTQHAQGGWWALLPAPTKPQPLAMLEEDVRRVLQRYASTSGAARNLTEVCRTINVELGRPYDDWVALYGRARRALPKLDKIKLIKARHAGAERAAKLPFKRRDTSVLRPLDVALIDGHTFKAKVRHPDHGAPFAPEVTVVIDAATRRVTGWSVDLSESTIAVGAAVRHAIQHNGVFALAYSDNGSGETAKAIDCPIDGLFARIGIEHRTGIPGHPQGHGLIERSWQTHMLRCARKFGSYQGGDVDDRTLRNVSAELAKEQRKLAAARANPGSATVVKLSAKCPSWAQFMDEVGAQLAEYNSTHRHRSHPKHTSGPLAGKHMTPDEAWLAWLDPADQVMLDPVALRHVFMPAVPRTAQRGEVRFLNAHFYSRELMEVDGQQVRVHYDIHDGSRVWVWTRDGRFVCEAVAGANAMGYMPEPVIELARRKRVAGMVQRREAQIDLARAELQPMLPAASTAGMFAVPARHAQPLEVLQRVDEAPAAHPAPQQHAGRPFFDSSAERFEWLQRHPRAWCADDQAWLAAYVASPDYEALAGYYASQGLQWTHPDPTAFKSAG